MKGAVRVSTPSRICLFGEHQDYLGLEVIALAIDLRFFAKAVKRQDMNLVIRIRDESINRLGDENPMGLYDTTTIDLTKPILYQNKRDYLKSTVNTLLKNGYVFPSGYDIVMDSQIPIGKGMCSSTTMIIALMKVLLELLDSPDKDDPEKIAALGFKAEVEEFHEPGGMMDHYTSALGGLVHLDFGQAKVKVTKLEREIPGAFILFDSLEGKNTLKVLADAKTPVVEALNRLKDKGISGIRDFVEDEGKEKWLEKLDELHRSKLKSSIDNYRILKHAEAMLKRKDFSPEEWGRLLQAHHRNLRDGLGISTPAIEKILQIASENGALGGKINGSGGGGCAFVYAYEEDCSRILSAVRDAGYPGRIIRRDDGVRREQEEEG